MGASFGPVTADRSFSTLKARRYEPAGKPITRITGQLGDLNTVIWKEIGLGVRTPECAWGWLGGEKDRIGMFG